MSAETNWIASIESLERGIVRITDLNGARFHYRQTRDGTLELGNPYQAQSPDGRYTVYLFSPMPHGYPAIIMGVVDTKPEREQHHA